MIYSSIRTDQDTQRLSTPTRIGVRHPKLSQVILMMEKNIEEPISPSILAKDVGMSTRQLERLFRRYLSRSPKRYYMELRLHKARNLLMQTDMSVINVALACGFASAQPFLKMLPGALQHDTPYRERGAQSGRLVGLIRKPRTGVHPIDGPLSNRNEPDRPVRGFDDVPNALGFRSLDLFHLAQQRSFKARRYSRT